MKKLFSPILSVLLIIALSACSAGATQSTQDSSSVQPVVSADVENLPVETVDVSGPIGVEYDSDDLGVNGNSVAPATITLQGETISVDGSGVTVTGSRATITAPGTYSLSGTLNDGQIVVDSPNEGTVVLMLNGANITCSTSAPIYIRNADKAVLTLVAGTENRVVDGAAYIFADAASDEPSAAIFSNDDLTINGSGSLTVTANYNNGIDSDDDLKITGGVLTVTAVNDGLKGKDSIAVLDGMITITAGGDGLQSNNDEDPEKGYIVIEGGTLHIVSGTDGIQAATDLQITGGNITISSGGGSQNGEVHRDNFGMGNTDMAQADTTPSAKGLKAGVDVTVTGGTLDIDSADDAIHANAGITIRGGDFALASGDDGLHAEATLTIDGGELRITQSYEGIESAVITINSGTVHLVASDDGINATGDAASGQGMRGESDSGLYKLFIHGGYVYVDANGDGIDINGTIEMTAGTVIVNGPTENMNGALDYLGSFTISGGTLVAVGSAGMAMAPSNTSTQASLLYNFQWAQTAGTLVHIETTGGQELLTFLPAKAYQSVLVSSPALASGQTCIIYTAGTTSGTVVDGLSSGGSYTAGTPVADITLTGVVTSNGPVGGGMPGPGGGRPGRP